MPPLQGVGTGQVHGNQFQGVEAPANNGLNGQAVRLGRGAAIRRSALEGLADVKSFFKGLGDRIKAHHHANVEKARTSIANRGAKKVVDGLLGSPVSDRKVLSGLKTVVEKAMKLDPDRPVDKAVEILNHRLGALTVDEKTQLFTANFGQMKSLMAAMGQLAREEGFAVANALHDMGMVDGQAPQGAGGPSAQEVLTGQLLDRLSNQSAAHFAHDLDAINTGLTDYFETGGITAEIMFRQDAAVTKEMAKHLAKVNGPALEGVKQQAISQAKQTSKAIGDLVIGNYTKADLASITPEQFEGILSGSAEILKSMMGGASEDGARAAANRLSPHVVRLLQMTDQQVSQHLDGNATARETAFVGTLFLRSLTPPMANAPVGQPDQTAAIIKIFSQIITYTLNQAPDIGLKMADLSGRNQEALTQFIGAYAEPLRAFRETVLARTDV